MVKENNYSFMKVSRFYLVHINSFGELVKHIHCFEQKRLAKLLSISAERDDALRKALIVSISIAEIDYFP